MNVFNGVVYNLMRVFRFKAVVGKQGIGVKCGAGFDMAFTSA